MHIKTNIELNLVHFVILAICPIMFAFVNAVDAAVILALTIVSVLISALICSIFNKLITRNVKIFVAALISSVVVTVANYFLGEQSILGLTSNNNYVFAVFATIILCIDLFYVDTKALVESFFVRVCITLFVFAVSLVLFATIREFLAFGTVFKYSFFKFDGIEFFGGVTFSLILLAFICVGIEGVYRMISKKVADKKIAYEKFVKVVRNEKAFQYDTLRREKLLTSAVEIKYLGGEEAEVIQEKLNTNEAIEEVSENKETAEEEEKPAKKKNKKLKVSKEAKVEKVYDKNKKGGA